MDARIAGQLGGYAARSRLLAQALRGDVAVGAHAAVDGNAVKLIIDNAAFRPDLLGDLQRANRVIDVQEFIWTNDGLGKEVADLLKRKAAEGVEVNMQLDGTGSAGFPFSLHKWLARPSYRAFVKDMRAAGVNVIENWRNGGERQLMPGALRSWDHRKLFIIDGDTAYIGGINLSQKYEHWHDVMVRLQGPAAAQAGAEFIGRWVDLGGTVSARHAAAIADAEAGVRMLGAMGGPSGAAAGGASVRVITNSPGSVRELTDSYLDDIRRATGRLWVTSPSIGSPQAVEALIAAKQRGVDVRVVTTSFRSRDGDPFTRMITGSFIDELTQHRIPVWESPRTVHAKVLLADDAATVSSFNLNMRSRSYDMEAGARATGDQAFIDEVVAMFGRNFEEATLVPEARRLVGWRQAVRGVRELLDLSF